MIKKGGFFVRDKPERSSNSSIQNSDEYEELKCSFCNKYLSISPIFTSNDGKINQCGRCNHESVEQLLYRNETYEKLAKHIQFPCSESENCKVKLVWGKVSEHEAICPLRKIICPNCGQMCEIDKILVHFRTNHICHSGNASHHNFQFVDDKTDVVLIDIGNSYFLAHFSLSNDFLQISVLSLTATDNDYNFTIGLTSNNGSINYSENHNIYTYPGYIIPVRSSARIKKESVIDVLEIRPMATVGIKLEIFKKGQLKPTIGNNSPAPCCKDIIFKAIECPICFVTMSSYIYLCTTGHSICANCKSRTKLCPTCRSLFQNGRNYALEALYQKLETVHPVRNEPFALIRGISIRDPFFNQL